MFTEDGNGVSDIYVTDEDGNVICARKPDGNYYAFHADVQGSTESITDQAGQTVAAYTYDDFGQTEEVGSPLIENEICFTGAVYDKSTGLYYMNARYYDPANGSFLTQDTYRGEPEDDKQWNLYAYCANDPVNYVDPSGHWVTFNSIKKRSKLVRGRKAKQVMDKYASNLKSVLNDNKMHNYGYINGQGDYDSIKVRGTDIAATGCGIVACHNALVKKNRGMSFCRIVAEFEYNMVIDGTYGVTYGSMKRFLKKHGVKSKLYRNRKKFEKRVTSSKPAIISVRRRMKAHYMMIHKQGKKIKGYNVDNLQNGYYDDFDELYKEVLTRSHFTGGLIIK